VKIKQSKARRYNIFQSKEENIVDVRGVELGREWATSRLDGLLSWVNECHAKGEGAERRTYDVNTKLSQSFFRSLVLCGFLRVPFPAANATSIYHGLNNLPMRR